MEIRFRATGPTTCEITWRMSSRNDGRVARVVLLPLATRVLAKRASRAMTRLKAILEATATRVGVERA